MGMTMIDNFGRGENGMTLIYTLGRGKENAVTQKTLTEKGFGKGEQIRALVHDARMNRVPVCSGSKGYYIAETVEELTETIAHLEARRDALDEVIGAMRNMTI